MSLNESLNTSVDSVCKALSTKRPDSYESTDTKFMSAAIHNGKFDSKSKVLLMGKGDTVVRTIITNPGMTSVIHSFDDGKFDPRKQTYVINPKSTNKVERETMSVLKILDIGNLRSGNMSLSEALLNSLNEARANEDLTDLDVTEGDEVSYKDEDGKDVKAVIIGFTEDDDVVIQKDTDVDSEDDSDVLVLNPEELTLVDSDEEEADEALIGKRITFRGGKKTVIAAHTFKRMSRKQLQAIRKAALKRRGRKLKISTLKARRKSLKARERAGM